MRGLSKRTEELIAFAYRLLAENHPMTLRQLHYAIFSADLIDYDNTQSDYKRLSRATTYARRECRRLELQDGADEHPFVIPHQWIVDELRKPERVSVWDNASEYLEVVKHSYRRDNWQNQPNYCEVWCEKGAVLGSLRPVTEELGVTLRVCRGFGSAGMEGQIGYLFEDINQPITVFYIGDHDPSGHDIERDIYKRAQEASGRDFEMERLAIHAADIKAFNLPPQKIKRDAAGKATDSRAATFEKQYGADAPTVELDALPVAELRSRVRTAIERLIEPEAWNRQVAAQQVEMNSIAEFVEQFKNLQQVHE